MPKRREKLPVILQVLRDADEALYELWRQSPLGSPFSEAISALQKDYIHPNIQHVREKMANGEL
jgi:hypothetical protein